VHLAGRPARAWSPRAAPTTWSPTTRSAPYALDRDAFLLGDPHVSYYAGRVLHHQGTRRLFAWRHADGQGRFLGELSDPSP
jgi:hypothetical protein